jgi:hypothetical protein
VDGVRSSAAIQGEAAVLRDRMCNHHGFHRLYPDFVLPLPSGYECRVCNCAMSSGYMAENSG